MGTGRPQVERGGARRVDAHRDGRRRSPLPGREDLGRVERIAAAAADQIAEVDKHTFEDAYGLPLFQSVGYVATSDKIAGVDKYQPNQTGVFWNVSEWSRK